MRFIITLLITGTCVIAAAAVWRHHQSVCDQPLAYRIGSIDPRFDLTTRDFQDAIEHAEQIWEGTLGRELFHQDATATFSLNLVFDERQRATVAGQSLGRQLERTEASHQNILEMHERWRERYEDQHNAYETRLERYREDRDAYEANVRHWNQRGGAPRSTFQALAAERGELEQRQMELERQRQDLQETLNTLQELEAESATLVTAYNRSAKTYNTLYGVNKPFHKGVYDGKAITIYQFQDITDLTLVLTHELGHALGIEHVANPQAIMHAVMNEQSLDDLTLHPADISAFNAICGPRTK